MNWRGYVLARRLRRKDPEPHGELARYAFGYSDKKPSAAFWIILVAMIIYILYNMITIKW